MLLASEVELGALYIMTPEALYIQYILQELGYPQLQTPIQTDNSMANDIVKINTEPKNKSNEHEITLVEGERKTGTIQILLAAKRIQFG